MSEIIHVETGLIEEPDIMLAQSKLIARYDTIVKVRERVFRKDVHYGQPFKGAGKDVLLKPGADVLCVLFQLSPDYAITKKETGAHREYEIICMLRHVPTKNIISTGVGMCTTMETKYRYRGEETEDTGKLVPSEYWDLRKSDPAKAQELLGGKGYSTKKNDNGQWVIVKKTGDKIENPDLADLYNTVLKMAKKRAYVDAVITATGSSFIFTQDIDEHEFEADEQKSGSMAFDIQEDQPSKKLDKIKYLSDKLLTKERAERFASAKPEDWDNLLIYLEMLDSSVEFVNQMKKDELISDGEHSAWISQLKVTRNRAELSDMGMSHAKIKFERERQNAES